MDQTLQEFLGINWPARSKKPRAEGITMVMDTGWPTTFCESMLAQYGEYLDVVKLWDPHLRAPEKEIRKKIEVYNHYNVQVQSGGTEKRKVSPQRDGVGGVCGVCAEEIQSHS